MNTPPDTARERNVLMVIAVGLIVILLAMIVGIFTSPRSLPNWAENVLVSIGTAAVLKLGDCLATLVQLSTGRSVERLGSQLGQSVPPGALSGDAERPKGTPDDPISTEPAP